MSKLILLLVGLMISFGIFAEECNPYAGLKGRECAWSEYQKADKKLNQLYKKILANTNNPKPFRDSQIGWLKYRDNRCLFESGDGSASKVAYRACLTSMTMQRNKELEELTKPCEEGVVGCGR